jgi:hypothetical protein
VARPSIQRQQRTRDGSNVVVFRRASQVVSSFTPIGGHAQQRFHAGETNRMIPAREIAPRIRWPRSDDLQSIGSSGLKVYILT